MKKFLLILLCALFAFNISAQRSAEKKHQKDFLLKHQKSLGGDTLTDHFIGNPILYTTQEGGYVAGNNEYGDLQKMQKFTLAYDCALPQILLWFGHAEGTGTFKATIWSDNAGIPGTVLESVTIPISFIDTSTLTPAIFSSPLYITAGTPFWAGIELPTGPGDTIGLYSSEDGTYPDAITNTFEQWSDGTYWSFADQSNWGLNIALGIFPIVWDSTMYNIIKGNVFLDANSNGVHDISENGIPYQLVKAGQYYGYTNEDGDYGIVTDTGQYSVKHIVQTYVISNPDSIIVSFPGLGLTSTGNDFACQVIPGIRDLSVSLVAGAFRPGFESEYYLFVKNEGTQIESGTAALNYDSQLNYLYSSPSEDSISGNFVFWDFTNLIPGGTLLINAIVETPQSLSIGTELISSAYVIPLTDDTVQGNNCDTLNHLVTGSYDPNDKLVYPIGDGPEGYIGLNPILLEYTIRFQNTGTDTAFTVVIKDTLNENLNLSTLKTLSSSHPVSLSLANSNVLNFAFNNILLPDSNVNLLGSNGFVKYSVSTKPELTEGTEVTNNAYIYFDYNPPVVTNTTLNTIGVLTSISEIETTPDVAQVFPNPMNITATIKLISENTAGNSTLQIYDILGNLVLSKKENNTNEIIIYRGNLKQGIYFYKISNDKKIFASGKFVIE
ncbi:MAG: T9SS type A sorting domain-containing protein [Bacteroidota bacterium]